MRSRPAMPKYKSMQYGTTTTTYLLSNILFTVLPGGLFEQIFTNVGDIASWKVVRPERSRPKYSSYEARRADIGDGVFGRGSESLSQPATGSGGAILRRGPGQSSGRQTVFPHQGDFS